MTQLYRARPPSSPTMVGMTVATIVTSIADTSAVMSSAAVGARRPGGSFIRSLSKRAVASYHRRRRARRRGPAGRHSAGGSGPTRGTTGRVRAAAGGRPEHGGGDGARHSQGGREDGGGRPAATVVGDDSGGVRAGSHPHARLTTHTSFARGGGSRGDPPA